MAAAYSSHGDGSAAPARPALLYELKRQHRPELWSFVRLMASPEHAGLPLEKLTSDHAKCAYCLRCNRTIQFAKGNHTVKEYLQTYHPEHLASFPSRKVRKVAATVETTPSARATSLPLGPFSRMHVPTPAPREQFGGMMPEQQQTANILLALWLAGSFQPLSIVEDLGFGGLLQTLSRGSGIQLPTQLEIRALIAEEANKLRATAQEKLLVECTNYVVSTDTWINCSGSRFLALTIHYLTADFHRCRWTLEVNPFSAGQSSAAIADGLTKLQTQWGLDPANCTQLLLDGTSNEKLTSDLLAIDHLPCIAHSLHIILAGVLIKKKPNSSDPEPLNAFTAPTSSAERMSVSSTDAFSPYEPEMDFSRTSTRLELEDIELDERDDTVEALTWQQNQVQREVAKFLEVNLDGAQRDVLNEVADVVQRFRTLSEYFCGYSRAWERLALLQLRREGRRPMRPTTDCPTRWVSTKHMLSRMLEWEAAMKPFYSYLMTEEGKLEFKYFPPPPPPSAADWLTVKCVMALLDPIVAGVEMMVGQVGATYTPVAVVFPCLRVVRGALARKNLFGKADVLAGRPDWEQEVVSRMSTARDLLLHLFDHRFDELSNELFWVSLLDPRLTAMSALSSPEAVNAKNTVVAAACEMAAQRSASLPVAEEGCRDTAPVLSEVKERMLRTLYGNHRATISRMESTLRQNRLRDRCEAELHEYLESTEYFDVDLDPLSWWQSHSSKFPLLAPLARKWLACVSTCVQSEHAFYIKGHNVVARRSALEPGLECDSVWIHANRDNK